MPDGHPPAPELRALEASFAAELVTLDRSRAYQSMMYSRQATPLTFELFDRFPGTCPGAPNP